MYLAQRTVKICKENYLIFFFFFQLDYFEAGYVFCSEFFPDLNNWNGNVFIDQKCILKLNSLGAIDNVYWNGKQYFLRSWSYKEHHVKTWREQSSSVWGRGVKGDEGERGCDWLAPLSSLLYWWAFPTPCLLYIHRGCQLSWISSLFFLHIIRKTFCPKTEDFRLYCRALIAPYRDVLPSQNTKFFTHSIIQVGHTAAHPCSISIQWQTTVALQRSQPQRKDWFSRFYVALTVMFKLNKQNVIKKLPNIWEVGWSVMLIVVMLFFSIIYLWKVYLGYKD